MLFFEDFIKKIEESNGEFKDKEEFSLDSLQKLAILGIGLPILSMGIFQIYYATRGIKINYTLIIIGVIICFLALKQLSKLSSFTITIDKANKLVKSREINLKFINIDSCTLKEMSFKRKIKPALDIVYYDNGTKRQLIIPLIMNKKVMFVQYFKKLLGKKFLIKTGN